MAASITDEILPSSEASPASPTSAAGQIPLEQPPKLKGRQKLLQNLQRMSSSPTLTRRGRSASTGYRRDHKASLSCVSLSSAAYSPCLSNGSSSQLFGGLNPRPATPGPSGLVEEVDGDNARIRLVDTETPNASRTVPLPFDLRPVSPRSGTPVEGDGPSTELILPDAKPARTVDFWGDMPRELHVKIFQYLTPREIVRCSAVSKMWHEMCYDGQLWCTLDAAEYYSKIPGDVLIRLITSGGPFVRDLNLRGCIQLKSKWSSDGERISDMCRNLVNLSLEGCVIDKSSMHYFLMRNPRLEYINVSGLKSVTNSAMKIIAQSCPQLQTLNVSWCDNVTTNALSRVIQSCERLRDLRASEIRGFDNKDFARALFERNTLERLIMSRTDVTDESLKVLMHGVEPAIDLLTDRPIVPPRRFKHLDLHHCSEITDAGLKSLAFSVPDLEGLQVSQCPELTDDAIIDVIRTTPKLSHLELEDLESMTNSVLVELSRSPCAQSLEHLNISYCENLGDTGMLQIMKNCPKLRSVEMDNTRVSDLTLMEASFRIRKRGYGEDLPKVGLRLVVFDCANVTWAGIKEVLSSNAYIPRARKSSANAIVSVTQTSLDSDSGLSTVVTPTATPSPSPTFPAEIIQLKCFYGWQMTVDEHTKRVLRGDLNSASRLDRKWADYMMATEEAGVAGAGARRRRRRAREAERLYNADEDEDDSYGVGGVSVLGGRRRRAQSGGCTVM
ncbi:F-box/LRR-repeat protein 2 [Penicillium rolfsii]|nr:F-box/LRR-repeat protein 2 [Penicillium rolfsii]